MDEVQDGTEKCVFLGMQKGLRISSLDGDDGEEEEPPPQQQLEVFAAYEEDEEEEEDFVILGFLEKPKNRWSLLRQMFPSKAGGVPVLINISFYPKDLEILFFVYSRKHFWVAFVIVGLVGSGEFTIRKILCL